MILAHSNVNVQKLSEFLKVNSMQSCSHFKFHSHEVQIEEQWNLCDILQQPLTSFNKKAFPDDLREQRVEALAVEEVADDVDAGKEGGADRCQTRQSDRFPNASPICHCTSQLDFL